MRINKFVALATGMGRRQADKAIGLGRVTVNGAPAIVGQEVTQEDSVALDNMPLVLTAMQDSVTLLLHKPAGYVVSRRGQGNQTIYDLLPEQYQKLKPIGRLDKNSSGLLLLTNDGKLAYELTHPSKQKIKVYTITLNKRLQPLHHQMVVDYGVLLEDGPSKLALERIHEGDDRHWLVRMHEGRNRQIRRTFAAIGYNVIALHRTLFGPYALGTLQPGAYRIVTSAHE